MKKPIYKARKGEFLDWNECRKYLESKLGKDIRDYANKFGAKGKSTNPYQDFWHWMCDHNDIANGCEVSIPVDQYPNEEPWIMEILGTIKAEFGDEPLFWVEW